MLSEILAANLNLTARQLNQFEKFYAAVIECNAKINLTAITDEKDFAVKHVLDSLTVWDAEKFAGATKIIDVGTGAGFPGIPLKIFLPAVKIVLLDSLGKRVDFLKSVVADLGLSGVECIHGRAEDLAHDKNFRERFDLATARAVSRLNVLAEYCLPFVKIGGTFAAMKGKNPRDEIAEAEPAIKILGGGEITSVRKNLPDLNDERAIIYVDKKIPTPKKFPRKAGTPAKNPLA